MSAETSDAIRSSTTLLIVGGGFSAITLASQLIRQYEKLSESSDGVPLNIQILETRDQAGGGTYNRNGVTVPMANPISVLGINEPGDFLDRMNRNPEHWKKIAPQIAYNESTGFDPVGYLTHNQYGIGLRDYLSELTGNHDGKNSPINLAVRYGSTIIDIWNEAKNVCARFSDNHDEKANALVLATGNVEPKPKQHLVGATGYYNLDDKGLHPSNVNETDNAIIIGTGNGAHFAVFSAIVNGYIGKFLLSGNNGLLPQVAGPPTQPYKRTIFTLDAINSIKEREGKITASKLKILFLRELTFAKRNNVPWRDVVDSTIPDVNKIWRLLTPNEQENFVRNFGFEWTHARYRMPQEHANLAESLKKEGRLVIRGDEIIVDRAVQGGFEGRYKGNDPHNPEIIPTSKVVNCTGPSGSIEHMSEAVRAMSQRDLIAQHPLGGLVSDDQMHLLGWKTENKELFYGIGPVLKGEFLESMTVPAIRSMAAELATTMLREHVFVPRAEPQPVDGNYLKRVGTHYER